MKAKSRIVALSLVAIVLGAGYLMRVIPPATATEVDDTDAVTIDGTIVTNPLEEPLPILTDIAPIPLVQTARSPVQPNRSLPAPNSTPAPGQPLTDILLASPEGTVIPGSLDEKNPESPSAPESEPTPEPPPSGTGIGGPPLIPLLTSPGSSPDAGFPSSPNDETSPSEPPFEEGDEVTVPDIGLPSNPPEFHPVVPDSDPKGPSKPWDSIDPISPPLDSDRPTHNVPDSGLTGVLAAVSIMALFAARRYHRSS